MSAPATSVLPARESADRGSGAKPFATSRKSQAKREAIIRAATEIINNKSFAQATMTEIASSLELRDATLYYYYPNKQVLGFECHLRSLDTFDRVLNDAEGTGTSGAECLQLFIEGMLRDATQNGPQLYFGDDSYLNKEQQEVVRTRLEGLLGRMTSILENGVADGTIAPCEPRLVVHLLAGMLIWLAKWVPQVEGLTRSRLMNAIRVVSFQGLDPRNAPQEVKSKA